MSITSTHSPPITIDDLLGPDEWNAGLRRDALAGLTARPRTLPPTWLYDDLGSVLYDEITRLPEYYPARTEQWILDRYASEIVAVAGAGTLVELGSGTSEKTAALLNAMAAAGELGQYVPFDVSEATLRQSAIGIATSFGIPVHGIVGDFHRHLDAIPNVGTRLFAFLGGTIGNLDPTQRRSFLTDLAQTMRPGDSLLVGTDRVKDRGRLVRAYDDAAGVTAAFNKNVLNVLNAELGATFDTADFDHIAVFDEANSWIEMRLRARRSHTVVVLGLGLRLHLAAGEEIRTEISSKFRPGQIEGELAAAGLTQTATWADPAADFALTMAVR